MHYFEMAPYCPAAVEAERLAFEEFWAEKDAQAAAKGKPPPVRPKPETKLHKWGRFGIKSTAFTR